MLSYGAAEPSFCLLWRFDLLKILLPLHVCVFTVPELPYYKIIS